MMMPFNEFKWFPDRMMFRDFVFRIEHTKNSNWESGENYFTFFKVKGLVDEYEDFFKKCPDFVVKNLFELGIYGGGSIAFWNELLNPEKHVGIDLNEKNEDKYLTEYFEKRKAGSNNIKTFGGINQANAKKLNELYKTEFTGPLDIVIDDASHLYGPTKISFETLFPLLRTGGLYIIEDWAWGHWEDFFAPGHSWAREIPLTKLINEITELIGSDNSIVKSIIIYQGFTVIERGASTAINENFSLERFIKRRPNHPEQISAYSRLKRIVKRVIGK